MYEQQTWKSKVRRFIKETIRVLRITKKPGGEEFKAVVKVTGLGMLAIGAVGFIIFMLKQLLL